MKLFWYCCLAVVLLGMATSLQAQQPVNWDPRGAEMTRAELDSMLARLTLASQSGAYSEELRQRSASEARWVRDRLNGGDFQTGDRIMLVVEGEQTLSDTFVVANGRRLNLPIVGDVPLSGVLRSELSQYLTDYIGRYIRNPTVHARSLVRVSVAGGVGRPGFYLVPADTPLPDVLMLAGGPGADVSMNGLRVERGTERLWQGEPLQVAMREGRTLDQLDVRAGDQIVLPRPTHTDFERTARVVGLILTIPAALYGIVHLF